MRTETFRKKNLKVKKEFVQAIIKGVHIHPDNVLRVDVWTSESHTNMAEEKTVGKCIPFSFFGGPLAGTSIEANGSENIVRLGTKPVPVPDSGAGFLLDGCSNNISNGGDERDRTADLYTASVTLSQLSYAPITKQFNCGHLKSSSLCRQEKRAQGDMLSI